MAAETETGLPGNPLILKGLWDSSDSMQSSTRSQESSRIVPETSAPAADHGKSMTIDFEEMVLANLRKAEERKRQTDSPQKTFSFDAKEN